MLGRILHNMVSVRFFRTGSGRYFFTWNRSERRDRLYHLLVNSLIMILTVAAILDIVLEVAGLKLKRTSVET